MPVVTLQLGQCGNQLGSSFFQTLGNELSDCDYGKNALEEYFRPLQGSRTHEGERHVARAVLIDMEPKVVNAARATADAAGGWWRYSPKGFLCMQSGSGNNWAHGFHGYGPAVHDDALDLVRKEVEACDLLGGFVLLQSMAGGTGAGLGTYVAQALRDEYLSSHIVNCCVWPYESGEVIVQSYNTLLTLSHLADVSDGIMLMSNEALHKLCNKLYNIPRPSFADMNTIAARAMANLLLPSSHRPAAGTDRPAAPSSSSSSAAGRASPGSGAVGTARGGRPAAGGQAAVHPAADAAAPLRLLPDIVTHLCCHPHFRLLTLRSIPQMPAASADFTTFTWQAMLKRLRQMTITGSIMEEGMDWGATMDNSPGTRKAAGLTANKSLANWLVLRGHASGEVDVSDFADPALYPPWSVDPLMVTSSALRFNKYMMSAAMLSNDQASIGPIRRMQDRAYAMLASRAFVHQYEKYGLGPQEFTSCFAHVEEMVERYASL